MSVDLRPAGIAARAIGSNAPSPRAVSPCACPRAKGPPPHPLNSATAAKANPPCSPKLKPFITAVPFSSNSSVLLRDAYARAVRLVWGRAQVVIRESSRRIVPVIDFRCTRVDAPKIGSHHRVALLAVGGRVFLADDERVHVVGVVAIAVVAERRRADERESIAFESGASDAGLVLAAHFLIAERKILAIPGRAAGEPDRETNRLERRHGLRSRQERAHGDAGVLADADEIAVVVVAHRPHVFARAVAVGGACFGIALRKDRDVAGIEAGRSNVPLCIDRTADQLSCGAIALNQRS